MSSVFLVLILVFLIFYLILAKIRLDWAVMLLLVALPSYLIRFSVLGIPTTLLESMILIATTVWVARNYKIIINNLKFKIKNCLKITNYKLKIHQRYPFDVEIVLILLVSWVAIIIAGVTSEALGIWKAYFFEPALVFILIFNVLKPKLRVMSYELRVVKILWALTVSAFVVSVIAIIERLTGWFSVNAFWPRVTGPFPYPNALGLYLGPLVLVMVGWTIGQIAKMQDARYKIQTNPKSQITNKLKIFKILLTCLTIVLSILAIYFARSEGALVGVIIGLIVMSSFWITGRIKKIKWLPGVLVFFVLIFMIFSSVIYLKIIPEHKYCSFDCQYTNYICDKIALKDLSGEIRKQQWRETWTMMRDDWRWLIGAGLSGYQGAVKPYHQEGIFFNKDGDPDFRRKIVHFDERYKAERWQPVEIYMYPHNLLLNFWTELGLAGALMFIWIMLKFLLIISYELRLSRFLWGVTSYEKKINSYLLLGLLGAMIVIITHGLVDVPYFKNDLAVMFWVLIALAGVLNLEKLQDRNSK